jgi:hypothetical protein
MPIPTDLHKNLARLLVVREVDRQDALDSTEGRNLQVVKLARATLEGAVQAVARVVNAYGPEQVAAQVRHAVGDIPRITSGGRRAWFEDRVERLAFELAVIEEDERGKD